MIFSPTCVLVFVGTMCLDRFMLLDSTVKRFSKLVKSSVVICCHCTYRISRTSICSTSLKHCKFAVISTSKFQATYMYIPFAVVLLMVMTGEDSLQKITELTMTE